MPEKARACDRGLTYRRKRVTQWPSTVRLENSNGMHENTATARLDGAPYGAQNEKTRVETRVR